MDFVTGKYMTVISMRLNSRSVRMDVGGNPSLTCRIREDIHHIQQGGRGEFQKRTWLEHPLYLQQRL